MPEYHTLEIKGRTATLSSNRTTIYNMTRDTSGALWISPDQGEVQIARATAGAQVEAQTLHEKYGHVGFDTLKTLPEYRQLQLSNLPELPMCQACQLSKTTKPAARANQGIRTSRTLERLHTDLIGPINSSTPGHQFRYLLTVTDNFSRYLMTKPLRKKNKAGQALIDIIHILQKATNNECPITELQADWGGEFHNHELNLILKQQGIIHKETVPRHSETNAIAERANRTIMTMTRTALIAAGLPKGL